MTRRLRSAAAGRPSSALFRGLEAEPNEMYRYALMKASTCLKHEGETLARARAFPMIQVVCDRQHLIKWEFKKFWLASVNLKTRRNVLRALYLLIYNVVVVPLPVPYARRQTVLLRLTLQGLELLPGLREVLLPALVVVGSRDGVVVVRQAVLLLRFALQEAFFFDDTLLVFFQKSFVLFFSG